MATIPTIDISAFLATEAQPSAPCKVSPQGPSVACEACRARSGITPHRHRLVGALTSSPLHPRGWPKGWLRQSTVESASRYRRGKGILDLAGDKPDTSG